MAYKSSRAFGPATTQAQFFAQSGVTSLLDDALQGMSTTLFAHGQTGSGKTHTILGGEGASGAAPYQADHPLGILPRALNYIFQKIAAQQQQRGGRGGAARFAVRISCLEIYQETVFDLMLRGGGGGGGGGGSAAFPRRQSLSVREHPALGFFVDGLSCAPVRGEAEATALVSCALAHRRVGAHCLNARSNRSHTMVTLYVDALSPADGAHRYGRVTFVDLAGSERLKITDPSGVAHREACSINRSLYTLGKVVQGINRGLGVGSVPFRDSKLTRLLIGSLGGKGRTLASARASMRM
ncbi:P-loop containing nucleoside triphosphate hydrolase protein [Tribonema minus]|uniref:Kinesin-like protein n=1 Tax=Tribonema minus TaxID=303371 RepID=A0A836CCB8_9STRA|nr:P-loop containing nucleoside triphosphate hydrolase protein [Tribonema minus]